MITAAIAFDADVEILRFAASRGGTTFCRATFGTGRLKVNLARLAPVTVADAEFLARVVLAGVSVRSVAPRFVTTECGHGQVGSLSDGRHVHF